MRFVILGAGAVGGTIGGVLFDAGHEVVLVARGPHAVAIREAGLRLATPDRIILARTEVVNDVSHLDLRAEDMIIIATKSQDTAPLLDSVSRLPVEGGRRRRVSAADLPVVCAQNGVVNERIALRRFRHVVGMCVVLPASLLVPGRIDAQGTPDLGILEIGRYPTGVDDATRDLAEALEGTALLPTSREDVMRWKYTKLLINSGNALEALCGTERSGVDLEIINDLALRAKEEGRRCLMSANIDFVAEEEWDAHRAGRVTVGKVEGRSRGGGSTWQSVVRGAQSIEADALNGEFVLLGRLHGIATPVNELLQREAAALIARGAKAGSVSPAHLIEALGH